MIVFNICQAADKRREQVFFWVESVVQRTRQGMCLLVGTHCGQAVMGGGNGVGIVGELYESVKCRYGSRVCGYMAVDSVDNIGKKQLQNAILELAKHQVCCAEY